MANANPDDNPSTPASAPKPPDQSAPDSAGVAEMGTPKNMQTPGGEKPTSATEQTTSQGTSGAAELGDTQSEGAGSTG